MLCLRTLKKIHLFLMETRHHSETDLSSQRSNHRSTQESQSKTTNGENCKKRRNREFLQTREMNQDPRWGRTFLHLKQRTIRSTSFLRGLLNTSRKSLTEVKLLAEREANNRPASQSERLHGSQRTLTGRESG